jgi:hypothetical protein
MILTGNWIFFMFLLLFVQIIYHLPMTTSRYVQFGTVLCELITFKVVKSLSWFAWFRLTVTYSLPPKSSTYQFYPCTNYLTNATILTLMQRCRETVPSNRLSVLRYSCWTGGYLGTSSGITITIFLELFSNEALSSSKYCLVLYFCCREQHLDSVEASREERMAKVLQESRYLTGGLRIGVAKH